MHQKIVILQEKLRETVNQKRTNPFVDFNEWFVSLF